MRYSEGLESASQRAMATTNKPDEPAAEAMTTRSTSWVNPYQNGHKVGENDGVHHTPRG